MGLVPREWWASARGPNEKGVRNSLESVGVSLMSSGSKFA